MNRTVFFADILGFAALSRRSGARPAIDALSDVAAVLAHANSVTQYLERGAPWDGRYALSDSLLLTARKARPAAAAAAELFFNLAFYSSSGSQPALLRGALVAGHVRRIRGLFSETCPVNLVGEAVVEAVLLEKHGGDGPRLFVSAEVARTLRGCPLAWLVDEIPGAPAELLWLLPPDPTAAPQLGSMIGDVGRAAVDLFVRRGRDPRVGRHYLAFIDLVARALERLARHDQPTAHTATRAARLGAARRTLRDLNQMRTLARIDGLMRET